MAIQKNITIDGIDVPFKASAAVPLKPHDCGIF